MGLRVAAGALSYAVQGAVFVEKPEEKRFERPLPRPSFAAPAAAERVPADDELLLLVHLQLQPGSAPPPRQIGARPLLGQHPLKAVLPGRLEEGDPLALQEARYRQDSRGPRGAVQQQLPPPERSVHHAIAPRVEDIERLERHRRFCPQPPRLLAVPRRQPLAQAGELR